MHEPTADLTSVQGVTLDQLTQLEHTYNISINVYSLSVDSAKCKAKQSNFIYEQKLSETLG